MLDMPCDNLFVPCLVCNAYVYTPWVHTRAPRGSTLLGKLERSSTSVELHPVPRMIFAFDDQTGLINEF